MLTGLCMNAQTSSTITISTLPSGARFMVDGQVYTQAAILNWPTGSTHIVAFLTDPLAPDQTTNTSVQTAIGGGTQYVFQNWTDNLGLLIPNGNPVQTVTANPGLTTLTASVQVSYRVLLNLFSPWDAAAPALCGAPGAIPPSTLRPGVVYVNSVCYWDSAVLFIPANEALKLNAFPYPGFVFVGWATNLTAPAIYLTSLTVTAPMTIAPQFAPGKRVHFLTNPLGLNVLIDHTALPTRTSTDVTGPCPLNAQEPVSTPAGIPPLCFGDVDLLPGSTHVISGVFPQIDNYGNYWVFESWSNGMGRNALYTVDNNTATPDTLTGTFMPGAHVGFLTQPTGLKLTIDGTPNWPPDYDFIWGLGETHTVTATPTQTDAKGRKYTFQSWSNAGAATQTVKVDQSAVSNGLLMIASYSELSRVVVTSAPTGVTVQVDGTSCQTPCNIDRASGTQVHVTAQTQIGMGPAARLDFGSWSDGGASDHMFTVSADYAVLTASYTTSYQLSATSQPANGISFQFSPASSDMFYANGTQVTVTATPNNGFKFSRWNGDLNGSYPSGMVTMSSPRNVIAMTTSVPYIAPVGVSNAAGTTPGSTVSPGSLISITGQSLSPQTDVGPVNPLAQAIDGVTVTVNDYILPLLYVSPQQINAQVPFELSDGNYTLVVHSPGQPDVSATFTVARNSPGLFGQSLNSQTYAIALHADGSVITPDSPAQGGETISLLGTGFGPYSAPVVDGFFPPAPPPGLTDSVSISLGNQNPTPTWSGAAPGYTGVAMTTFQVPPTMAGSGMVQLTVSVNSANSNTVMLPVQ
ncbi:MAG TPA: IPT/TIG domain-containing protein [Bryobacteraceae bacterium]|nr:IPT/TIG domain-containing protein [Bryobacteraceae bacterium]